jgi:ubiquinone/menaquinone biosynthesis C-methylase UbiE
MNPSFLIRWHSIFNNPFYFIRKGLNTAIKQQATALNGHLLDFGCGSKPYEEYFKHCTSYTGLDIEVSGHSHQHEKIDVFYDGKTIPFPDNHFDAVFSTEVLEHIFNPDTILKEIYRVMKPGAHLLLTCPFTWPEHEIPYDYARYSSFGLKSLAEKNGFELVNQEKTGHFFEVIMQQWILYVFYWIPKKPSWLYLTLHQLLLLPFVLVTIVVGRLLPSRMKRKDLYHSNILLVKKV